MTIGVRKNTASLIYVGKSSDLVTTGNLPTVTDTFVDTWGETYNVEALYGLLKNATYGTIVAGGIVVVTQPANATISAVGDDGSFTYTNDDGVLPYSDNSFTFTIEDENGVSEIATCFLNCQLAFVNKLYVNETLATDLIANSLSVPAVYANHELVYGEVTTTTGGRVDFAELPSQIFVAGYAETVDMNLFILDPSNRYPRGKTPWDHLTLWPETIGVVNWKCSETFTPNITVDLIGTLPPGVTWNKAEGKLVYDGTAIAMDYDYEVYFSYGGKVSETFRVQLLIPKLIWPNVDGLDLETSVNNMYTADPTEPYPVVMVLDGTYTPFMGTDNNIDTANSLNVNYGFQCCKDRNKLYLIGEPNLYPMLSSRRNIGWDDPYINDYDGTILYNDSANSNNGYFTLEVDNTTEVYVKGFQIRMAKYNEGSTPGFFISEWTNCRFSMCAAGNDFFEGRRDIQTSETTRTRIFYTQIEHFWSGSSSSRHFWYNHSAPEYAYEEDSILLPHTFYNGIKVWESGHPNKGWGEGIKDISRYHKIRNFWISQFRDPYNPDESTAAGEHPLNSNVFAEAVIYNGFIAAMDRQQDALFIGARGFNAGGLFAPCYFDWPDIGIADAGNERIPYPMWPDWSGDDPEPWVSIKGVDFHGPNADKSYSLNGLNHTSVGATIPAPGLLSGCTIDMASIEAITCSKITANYEVFANLDGSFFFNIIRQPDEFPVTRDFTFTVTDKNGISNTATVTMNCDTGGAAADPPSVPINDTDTGTNPVVINNTFALENVDVDAFTPNPAIVNNPFWDGIPVIKDLANDHRLFNRKWVSYVDIMSIDTSYYSTIRYAARTVSDQPASVMAKFSSNTAAMSVPPNWKTLTHTYTCNISTTGYNPLWDLVGGTVTDHEIKYPYQPAIVPDDIYTEVGGVVREGSGAFIELPAFFKI